MHIIDQIYAAHTVLQGIHKWDSLKVVGNLNDILQRYFKIVKIAILTIFEQYVTPHYI